MIVGVPKEIFPGERRVALVPSVLPNLAKAGLEVIVEPGAGAAAGYLDSDYVAKGGKIVSDRAAVFATADIIVQVLCYGSNDKTGQLDLPLFRRDQVLIGFLRPFGTKDVVQALAATGVTSFAVELMPRTTRAQSMDALVLDGDGLRLQSDRFCGRRASRGSFPMMTTAAGTVTPARVFVMGCGSPGAGDRHGDGGSAPSPGLRCSPGRQGAGAEPWGTLRRAAHRSQGRPRRSWLCASPGRGFYARQRELLRQSRRRKRSGDHRSRDSRKEIAHSGDR